LHAEETAESEKQRHVVPQLTTPCHRQRTLTTECVSPKLLNSQCGVLPPAAWVCLSVCLCVCRPACLQPLSCSCRPPPRPLTVVCRPRLLCQACLEASARQPPPAAAGPEAQAHDEGVHRRHGGTDGASADGRRMTTIRVVRPVWHSVWRAAAATRRVSARSQHQHAACLAAPHTPNNPDVVKN
jgi:hypothetical protein